MINVTKTYLPDMNKYMEYVAQIYSSHHVTNNGRFVQELKKRLEDYLDVNNLLLVGNGTLALQIAYKALGIKGNAITTPFTYIATSSSLEWEGIKPLFADINDQTFCLEAENITGIVDKQTRAIVPVHVYGNSCDIESIETVATEFGLKAIYDASHAFGVKYMDKSIFSYGDAVTVSFHATKLFHTIEGGAVVFKERETYEKAKKMINFGQGSSGRIDEIGINAKMNEFQAAMGLCVIDDMKPIMESRRELVECYDDNLSSELKRQLQNIHSTKNYSYYPVLFDSEEKLHKVINALESKSVYARRYFYPSLNEIDIFGARQLCPVSSDISRRVLCLPLYPDLTLNEVESISAIINRTL